MSQRATYLRSARTITSVSVSPFSSAFAFAARHNSSATRTFRSGVGMSGPRTLDAVGAHVDALGVGVPCRYSVKGAA